jgi:predicted outer membrane repeat protein
MSIMGGTTPATGVTIDINQKPQAFFVNNSTTTLYLSNLTFENGHNKGGFGGAIHIGGATVNVTNCAFLNNAAPQFGTATGFGGAFSVGGLQKGGTLNVTNSTFSGNSTGGNGGAIFDGGGTVNVTNCTFLDNNADVGGALSGQSGALNVTNSTFSDNSAEFGGAIAFVST